MRARFSASTKIALTFAALSIAMLFGGCSSLQISAPNVTDAEQASASGQANIIVVKKGAGRSAVATTIPFKPSMVVDEAMEKSGAKSWFNRCKVSVVRGSENGEKLKMDVEYDNGQDRVEPLYDYALQAGDRVVVNEDTSNVLTDILSELSPLSP